MGKLQKNTKLTSFQFFVMIVITSFSSIAFMDIGLVTQTAGADGWITCIIVAFLAVLEIFIIISLSSKFPNDTVFTISKKVLGKYIGMLVNIIYILYSILFTSFVLKVFLTIVYNMAFRETPILLIIILYYLTAVYISTKNIVVISRVAELSFMLFLIITTTIPLLMSKINIDYLLPIGSSGFENILKAAIPYLNSFLGLYIILLLFPYVDNKKKCMKIAIAAVCFRTIVFAFYYIMIIGISGPRRVSVLFWPLLKQISTISSPIFERIDVVLIMLWAGICLISIYVGFYFSKVGILETLNLKGNKKDYFVIAFLFIISVYLTQIPKNYHELIVYNNKMVLFSIVVNFIFPFILLMLSLLLKRSETAS